MFSSPYHQKPGDNIFVKAEETKIQYEKEKEETQSLRLKKKIEKENGKTEIKERGKS